jgi:hypothetical protein
MVYTETSCLSSKQNRTSSVMVDMFAPRPYFEHYCSSAKLYAAYGDHIIRDVPDQDIQDLSNAGCRVTVEADYLPVLQQDPDPDPEPESEPESEPSVEEIDYAPKPLQAPRGRKAAVATQEAPLPPPTPPLPLQQPPPMEPSVIINHDAPGE